jgi:hypothetical protein
MDNERVRKIIKSIKDQCKIKIKLNYNFWLKKSMLLIAFHISLNKIYINIYSVYAFLLYINNKYSKNYKK